jgi:hypothetical protein
MPCPFGSGKVDTPWARMHRANSSPGSVLLPLGLAALVTVPLGPPVDPQPASATATATIAMEAITELPHGIGRVDLAPGCDDQRYDLI